MNLTLQTSHSPFSGEQRGALARGARLAVVAAIVPLMASALAAQDRQPAAASTTASRPKVDQRATSVAATIPDEADPWQSGRYRLTPSDVIELQFPYVPEFDQTVTVQPDGYVSLRVVGDIRVAGRTLPQFKEALHEAYANVLREPLINVVLREFEKPYFMVAGEVSHPGKYELRGATTLTQALAVAGGHTRDAKHSQVILFRRFSTEWLEAKEIDVKKMFQGKNLSEDPLLRAGDTVYVPRNAMSKIAPYLPKVGLGLYLNVNPLQ